MLEKIYTKKVYTRRKAIKELKKGRCIAVSGEWLRKNQEFYIEALNYTESVLEEAEHCIVNNSKIIKKGIKRWGGHMLKYASEELQKDDQLVRMALVSEYDVICDMHNDSYDCLYDKRFVKEILTKMDNDYAKLMRKPWFDVSNCKIRRNNLLAAAIVLWHKLPKKVKNDSEVYDIAARFVNPAMLV